MPVQQRADRNIPQCGRSPAIANHTGWKHGEVMQTTFLKMLIHIQPQTSSPIDVIDEYQLAAKFLRSIQLGKLPRLRSITLFLCCCVKGAAQEQ